MLSQGGDLAFTLFSTVVLFTVIEHEFQEAEPLTHVIVQLARNPLPLFLLYGEEITGKPPKLLLGAVKRVGGGDNLLLQCELLFCEEIFSISASGNVFN